MKLKLYASNPGPPSKYKTYAMDKINDNKTWGWAYGKEALLRPRASWFYF